MFVLREFQMRDFPEAGKTDATSKTGSVGRK
jgi:hypothetical protein